MLPVRLRFVQRRIHSSDLARNDNILVNSLAYGGLRTLSAVLGLYDVNSSMRFFGDIGEWWHRHDRRRRLRAEENIRRSFPHLLQSQVEDIARRSLRHLLQLFCVEVTSAARLVTPTTWMNYLRFGDVDEALALLLGRDPVILITGHCGNFEMLGYGIAAAGFPVTALARPLDLPMINDWLVGVRQRRGMRIITKFGASEAIPDILGQGGRVAFIADQNAGDKGLFVPFFGRLASAYKSIGLMAIRYETPIVCGLARRERADRFAYVIEGVDVIRPRDWRDQPDPLYYVTARYTRAIETMVHRAPEQYFWVHRRWKSRPRHEVEGKAFPVSLRRKIESLPWMTSEDVERVVAQSENESRASTTQSRSESHANSSTA